MARDASSIFPLAWKKKDSARVFLSATHGANHAMERPSARLLGSWLRVGAAHLRRESVEGWAAHRHHRRAPSSSDSRQAACSDRIAAPCSVSHHASQSRRAAFRLVAHLYQLASCSRITATAAAKALAATSQSLGTESSLAAVESAQRGGGGVLCARAASAASPPGAAPSPQVRLVRAFACA